MIKELTWDSALFKRKIGEFIPVSQEPAHIRDALKKAKKDGFKYLTYRTNSQDTMFIRLLETLGFYLTDIGVVLAIKTDIFFQRNLQRDSKIRKSVKVATYDDLTTLRRLVKTLFLESRFYNDPFFTKGEADRLYEVWIENSVKGEVSDIVYCVPQTGFITCKKSGGNSGEIVLIGIKKGLRGRGIGSALTEEAMRWFKKQRITRISVRTQLKNLSALNFYVNLGFQPEKYDIAFAKIL
jgi:dTDP-4-amino-4,6-dideoxy-D-galactose acyltransferase